MFDTLKKLYPDRYEEYEKKATDMEWAMIEERYKLYQDMFSEDERFEIMRSVERKIWYERVVVFSIAVAVGAVAVILAHKALLLGWHWLYLTIPPWLLVFRPYWLKLVGTYDTPRSLWVPMERLSSDSYGLAVVLAVFIWFATHPPC